MESLSSPRTPRTRRTPRTPTHTTHTAHTTHTTHTEVIGGPNYVDTYSYNYMDILSVGSDLRWARVCVVPVSVPCVCVCREEGIILINGYILNEVYSWVGSPPTHIPHISYHTLSPRHLHGFAPHPTWTPQCLPRASTGGQEGRGRVADAARTVESKYI